MLVTTLEVMPRRRRSTRPQSPPKVPIPTALEEPQVLPSIEIEEVQAIQKTEPESIGIMLGGRDIEGLSEEEAFKKSFYDLTNMVRVLYEQRNTRMAGENSKNPHGEGSSGDKKYDKKDSKGNGGKPPPYPPSSSSSSSSSSSIASQKSSNSTTKTFHTHSQTPKGKTPLLKLDIKFELPMYNGEVNA